MFSTLKNSTDAEGTYVLEPTRPPFDSKRQGKLARVACTHCRAKKLKCSGDTNGCARCLSKKIECRFPTPGNSAQGERSSVSSAESPPSASSSAPPADEKENGGSATAPAPDDDVDALMNLDHPSTALFLESLNAQSVPAALMDTSASTIQWPFDDLFPIQDLQPVGGGAQQMNDSRQEQPFTFSPTIPSYSVSLHAQQQQQQQRQQAHSGPDLSCCDCITQAIQTHESIQVDLVVLTSQDSPAPSCTSSNDPGSDSFNSTSLIDVLQHQKAALGCCKALVACTWCRAQSAYVMLAISMCAALLESIEHLHQLVASAAASDDAMMTPPPAKAQRRSHHKSSSASSVHSRKSSLAHVSLSGSNDADSRDGSPFPLPRAGQHRRGVQIGRWKLDDEDETHVVQGLLSARMLTLGRVIDGIEQTVDENQWQAHENAVRRLRGPFSLACLRVRQQSSSEESLDSR